MFFEFMFCISFHFTEKCQMPFILHYKFIIFYAFFFNSLTFVLFFDHFFYYIIWVSFLPYRLSVILNSFFGFFQFDAHKHIQRAQVPCSSLESARIHLKVVKKGTKKNAKIFKVNINVIEEAIRAGKTHRA